MIDSRAVWAIQVFGEETPLQFFDCANLLVWRNNFTGTPKHYAHQSEVAMTVMVF